MMQRATASCPRCRQPLSGEILRAAAMRACGACGVEVMVVGFPALWREPAAAAPAQQVVLAEHASCFYHAANQAASVCEQCGRYLCSLCDVEFEGAHLCPSCIAAGLKGNRFGRLDNQRAVHGGLALMLAFAPLLVWPFTCITAPVALYVALRYWKAPGSITGRERWRNVVAALMALAQIAGWIVLLPRILM